MIDQTETKPPPPDARDRSLPDDVRELATRAKTFASAELAFQKSRALFVVGSVRAIAIYLAVALVLAFFALIGLTVGLILALTPWLTAWGATAVVVGTLLLVAAVLAWAALRRWRAMTRLLGEDDE